jgi:hypothetical protein
VNDRRRDLLLGSVVAVFAIAYIGASRAIEDSLLADAVGAGGVPQASGIVLLMAAVLLMVKALRRDAAPGDGGNAEALQARPLLLGAALVALLVSYVLLLPLVGYIVSVSLLVGTVALLAGARDRRALVACTAFSGIALWAMFEWALKIRMPAGTLFG